MQLFRWDQPLLRLYIIFGVILNIFLGFILYNRLPSANDSIDKDHSSLIANHQHIESSHFDGDTRERQDPISSNLNEWEIVLQDAKEKDRPWLSNWSKEEFATRRLSAFNAIAKAPAGISDMSSIHDKLASKWSEFKVIQRIRYEDLSYEDFVNHFEKPDIPVIISGVPENLKWKANWSFPNLKEQYGDGHFQVGRNDQDNTGVRIELKHYLEYMVNNRDDAPLYLFDGYFRSDEIGKNLLQDYSVPRKYFPEELLSLLGDDRPIYSWWTVGPKRTGARIHTDPLGESAWNTLLVGRKRWVLFPPDLPAFMAEGHEVYERGESSMAVNYFIDIIPRLKKKYQEKLGIVEFTQLPGDTLFIPGGWWHSVLNLDDAVAVTQNFASTTNFPKVWRVIRAEDRLKAIQWKELLKINYSHLVELSEKLDEEDGFNLSAD